MAEQQGRKAVESCTRGGRSFKDMLHRDHPQCQMALSSENRHGLGDVEAIDNLGKAVAEDREPGHSGFKRMGSDVEVAVGENPLQEMLHKGQGRKGRAATGAGEVKIGYFLLETEGRFFMLRDKNSKLAGGWGITM